MSLNNEKVEVKSQTDTSRAEARSQAPQAQENRSGQEGARPHQGKLDENDARKETSNSNNGSGEKIPVASVEDVAQRFLAKGRKQAAEYIDIIEDMLGDYSSYHFAESTLIGIYDFIQENGYITDKQVEAIENIKKSVYER